MRTVRFDCYTIHISDFQIILIAAICAEFTSLGYFILIIHLNLIYYQNSFFNSTVVLPLSHLIRISALVWVH